MNKKLKIIIAIATGILSAVATVAILAFGPFKQCEKVYHYVDYDLDEDTGLISVKVEGQKLLIGTDKILSLPTDYESGNALYVSEYKTLFFTKTVYKAERFVILVPTDGHYDDWKLGV